MLYWYIIIFVLRVHVLSVHVLPVHVLPVSLHVLSIISINSSKLNLLQYGVIELIVCVKNVGAGPEGWVGVFIAIKSEGKIKR